MNKLVNKWSFKVYHMKIRYVTILNKRRRNSAVKDNYKKGFPVKLTFFLEETVTFEDVAVNFTEAEWALLNPPQKKIYIDVMWETCMHMTAIQRTCGNQQMEEQYKDCSGNLRNDADRCLRLEEMLCKCNEYGKNWSDLHSFQKHEMRKTREKQHQSEQCEKAYSDLSEQTHPGEKTFLGKKNVKASSTPSCFPIQERKHSVGSPYVYKQCEKTFMSSYYIQPNERIHAGEKPYVTKECVKALSHTPELMKEYNSVKCAQAPARSLPRKQLPK
ncbi:zinc finger protein 791-like [Heterocephalus glaber]|uniref:Zinc finger protein 791-like n=1 Tax=Heterocephalus glaber TaxID=10181 RepID=A0AAX6Q9G6_HETGA|nr:zinc finger protein 791-like [Heterocephalus glaber]